MLVRTWESTYLELAGLARNSRAKCATKGLEETA